MSCFARPGLAHESERRVAEFWGSTVHLSFRYGGLFWVLRLHLVDGGSVSSSHRKERQPCSRASNRLKSWPKARGAACRLERPRAQRPPALGDSPSKGPWHDPRRRATSRRRRGRTSRWRRRTMAMTLQRRLYTAEASVQGGREGHGRSSDGVLDLDIRPPKELDGSGVGTNPEQLFALGYGACFQSAMCTVGRRLHVDTSSSTVTARVTLGSAEGGRYGIAVELDVAIPDVARETAEQVVKAAHEECPYSNATRGNI